MKVIGKGTVLLDPATGRLLLRSDEGEISCVECLLGTCYGPYSEGSPTVTTTLNIKSKEN